MSAGDRGAGGDRRGQGVAVGTVYSVAAPNVPDGFSLRFPELPMSQEDKMLRTLAGVFGFTAVAAGAFGAHVLRADLPPAALQTWETAARYQVYTPSRCSWSRSEDLGPFQPVPSGWLPG